MSDIPKAREILEGVLNWSLPPAVRAQIGMALELMHRRPPIDFVARVSAAEITDEERFDIFRLRALGMSIAKIAAELGTNSGRVSEVINPKPEKRI